METFNVTYHITLLEGESIKQKIDDLCLEQSVELPRDVLNERQKQEVVGTPLRRKQIKGRLYEVVIQWPVKDIGNEVTQFLNLLYGNISLKPGICIHHVQWDKLPTWLLPGPSFGISAIRKQFGANHRPLSCSAIKPMGLSAEEFGKQTYQMACGGIDIIKDDHGLANQAYAPFEERVSHCVKAVKEAAADTGHRSHYYPNITADHGMVLERYQMAAELGADGVLVSPHLTGLSTLITLAISDISLPIIAHPAFSGNLVENKRSGMTPSFLYGQLWRALGADFVIFPNSSGRFSFTEEQCQGICSAATSDQLPFEAAFPMIGGGIELDNLSDWMEIYGKDSVFLIGSSLYRHSDGLRYASKLFSETVRGNL